VYCTPRVLEACSLNPDPINFYTVSQTAHLCVNIYKVVNAFPKVGTSYFETKIEENRNLNTSADWNDRIFQLHASDQMAVFLLRSVADMALNSLNAYLFYTPNAAEGPKAQWKAQNTIMSIVAREEKV